MKRMLSLAFRGLQNYKGVKRIDVNILNDGPFRGLQKYKGVKREKYSVAIDGYIEDLEDVYLQYNIKEKENIIFSKDFVVY